MARRSSSCFWMGGLRRRPRATVIGDGRRGLSVTERRKASRFSAGELLELGSEHVYLAEQALVFAGWSRCQRLELAVELAGQLGQCRDEPVLLFMHHPPLPTGIEAMDACSLLEGGDELAALVRAHGRVQGILCGHLHRPVQMQFGGAPLHVAPSVAHQIALDLRPGAALHAQLEPPKISLHRWSPVQGLCTHLSYVQAFGPALPL